MSSPESNSKAPNHEAGSAEFDENLSFNQAQTALELSLAELQASELDVETMMALYRRAQGYADRCETLLQQVEQEVMKWDPTNPEASPHPYKPE